MSSTVSQYAKNEAPTKKGPQSWRCGDEFQYPLPEPEGDPWNLLLEPMLERDTVQCNAWVDEVQNLLIFAGLFSAVVTAFAVDTYKDLQQDPVVALLTQIAANSANNGSAAMPPPFTPGASTIRLNVFLFLSLILSLSTVLVGIIALQWIREHRQHNNTLTPQNLYATLHMRTEALQKWHVPQIFAALPLLLQSALVFFFAGIIQLLVDASTIVLIPVAFVMGMTIIFLVLTTILPTAQAATLTHSPENIPAPCPFKSPQANAFRQLITSSKTLFTVTSFSFSAIYWTMLHLVLLPRKAFALVYHSKVMRLSLNSVETALGRVLKLFFALLEQGSPLLPPLRNARREQWNGFDYMKPLILDYWRLHSWFEFDLAWMSVRDNYFQSICPPESWLFENRKARQQYASLYDATQGLCEEVTKNNFNRHVHAEPAIITAYHCALKLCSPSVGHFEEGDTVVSHFMRNQYLATLLGLGDVTPLRPFSDKLCYSDLPTLIEEASFIFLNFIQDHLKRINERSPLLTNHYAEIYLRLLGELYSKPYEMNNDVHVVLPINTVLDGEELYVMQIYDVPNQPFTHQWALSITSFFSVLGDSSIPHLVISTSFHAHPFFRGYSANFWRQVKYEMHTQTSQETTINEIINTMSIIDNILRKCFTGIDNADADQARDMVVFQSAAVHLWNYANREIIPCFISEAVNATTESLHAAQKRLLSLPGSDSALGQRFRLSVDPGWLAEDWWVGMFQLDAIPEHSISAATSPVHSCSHLSIEFGASNDT